MPNPRQPAAPSSFDRVKQTLLWLRRLEFKPVALMPQSKAAVSRHYADPSYNPPFDDYWREGDYGVGVVTGPLAHGPIDVDLDCPEAIFLAPTFLPVTNAIFGRSGKRASHYLYRTDAEEFPKRSFIDPISKSTILELRGDGGHQTVMPGSLHQDTGELIEWNKLAFPEVPTVPADDLLWSARYLAMIVLIARHAWVEGQRNEVCKHLAGMLYYLEWSLDAVESVVSSVMALTNDTDRTRLATVRNTFKKGERSEKITGARSLKKLLQDERVVDRLLDWAGSSSVNMLQEYNEQYAVVAIEGKFRIADTDVPPGQIPTFYAKDDFLNMKAADYEVMNSENKQRAKLWLANPRRRSYRTVDFMPGQEDGGDILNLWTGWSTAPAAQDEPCYAWYDLLHDVVCGGSDELTDWMMNWFTNILKEPTKKPLTAPVIIGRQGAGKSLLFSYFGRILGPSYITITNEEHIYGRFNWHLATALLLHSEEALYGGEKRHRGIIKSLITDEFRIFEQKGVDAKRVKNYLRLALTSNDQHAAPVEAGDRRFTVIDMAHRMIPQTLLKEVLHERETTGPAGLHRFLITEFGYDPLVPRANLKNETLGELKSISYTPLEEWWDGVLTQGQLLPDHLNWAQRPDHTVDWPELVSSSALYTAMSLNMKRRGVRTIPTEAMYALQLNKFVGVKLTRAQRTFENPLDDHAPPDVRQLSNRQNAILNMPSLDDCRKAFERHIGQSIAWPADDDDSHVKPYEPKERTPKF